MGQQVRDAGGGFLPWLPILSSDLSIGHVVRKAQKCVAVEPKGWDQYAHTYMYLASYIVADIHVHVGIVGIKLKGYQVYY